MKYILAITAIALCGALAAPVSAQPANGPSVAVSYADLNLSSQSGRSALDGRIDAAIKRVCPDTDPRDLMARASVSACRANALKGSRDQLASIYGNRGYAQAQVEIAGGRADDPGR